MTLWNWIVDAAGETDTRERIMNEAERLYAERGFESVSLRNITSAADVNLAAVNYHFGSKLDLTKQVIARRIHPLNKERLRRLKASEEGDGREILKAFISPILETVDSAAFSQSHFVKLMGRCLVEPPSEISDWLIGECRDILFQFSDALHQAFPHLNAAQIQLRLLFTAGMMGQTLIKLRGFQSVCTLTGNQPPSLEFIGQEMIEFAEAGFRKEAS